MKKFVAVFMLALFCVSAFAYDDEEYVGLTDAECVSYGTNYDRLHEDLIEAGLQDGAIESDEGYEGLKYVLRRYGFTGDVWKKYETFTVMTMLLDYDYFGYIDNPEYTAETIEDFRNFVSEKDYKTVKNNLSAFMQMLPSQKAGKGSSKTRSGKSSAASSSSSSSSSSGSNYYYSNDEVLANLVNYCTNMESYMKSTPKGRVSMLFEEFDPYGTDDYLSSGETFDATFNFYYQTEYQSEVIIQISKDGVAYAYYDAMTGNQESRGFNLTTRREELFVDFGGESPISVEFVWHTKEAGELHLWIQDINTENSYAVFESAGGGRIEGTFISEDF